MKERLNNWFFTRHLDDDEDVAIIVHRHWLIGFRYLFWPIVSFLGCAFLLTAYDGYNAIFYAIALWAMMSLIWFLRNFFDYYLDAWIITDQGIIDVAWHGWFHRESTRVLYSDIQGVSYEIQGITSTLLRYGVISIEKISTGNLISLDHVARPRRVEMIIMKKMEEYMHGKNLKDAKHIQEILSSVVAREVQLEDFEDDEEYEDDDDYEGDEYEDDDE